MATVTVWSANPERQTARGLHLTHRVAQVLDARSAMLQARDPDAAILRNQPAEIVSASSRVAYFRNSRLPCDDFLFITGTRKGGESMKIKVNVRAGGTISKVRA